jgi:NADP-dependent 3-hydroxy acid dehydrogenase YdfG
MFSSHCIRRKKTTMSSNPIILITGANTGLGFETVKSLCQSPKAYTILLGGRSIEKANAAAERAQKEFPKSASIIKIVQVDIEDDDSISQAFEHVASQYGQVDILVNNAGKDFENSSEPVTG